MSKEPTFCFADCELDAAAYQLRRAGRVVPLTRQPMEALLLLVERDLVALELLGGEATGGAARVATRDRARSGRWAGCAGWANRPSDRRARSPHGCRLRSVPGQRA